MTTDIEQIKFELLAACEEGTAVDIGEWVRRYPEHTDDLLDFWLWARPGGATSEDTSQGIPGFTEIQREALHRACLAVSLGSEWLRPLAVEVEIGQLARQMQVLRSQPTPKTPASRRPFRRAVVYAWVIDQLGAVRTGVSRLATQKAAYLLESFLVLELFDAHQKKPLGPYDHTARYKDAEPIAEKKGWIQITGSMLQVGDKAGEFRQYAQRYLRSPRLALLLTRWLGRLTDDQLETLATVHWVASKLSGPAQSVTPSTVSEAIERDTRWYSKLGRENFGKEQIAAALTALTALGLLAHTGRTAE